MVLEVLLMPDPVPRKEGGSLSSHLLGLFPGKIRTPCFQGYLTSLPPVL